MMSNEEAKVSSRGEYKCILEAARGLGEELSRHRGPCLPPGRLLTAILALVSCLSTDPLPALVFFLETGQEGSPGRYREVSAKCRAGCQRVPWAVIAGLTAGGQGLCYLGTGDSLWGLGNVCREGLGKTRGPFHRLPRARGPGSGEVPKSHTPDSSCIPGNPRPLESLRNWAGEGCGAGRKGEGGWQPRVPPLRPIPLPVPSPTAIRSGVRRQQATAGRGQGVGRQPAITWVPRA